MFDLRPERPADAPAIDALLDRAFGADRHRKSSYAFRRDVAPIAALSHVAVATAEPTRLLGTIRFWPVAVGEAPALLLGPLGVEPEVRGRGVGRALLAAGLADARQEEPPLPILLVGDIGYYAPLGFAPAPPATVLPGEDPRRLLVAPGTAPPAGLLRPWHGAAPRHRAPAFALN